MITCCSQQAKLTTLMPRPEKRAEALNLIQFTSYKFNKLILNRKFFLTSPNARRGNRNLTTTPARSQIQSTFRFNFPIASITINRTTPSHFICFCAISPLRFHNSNPIWIPRMFSWDGMNGWLDG